MALSEEVTSMHVAPLTAPVQETASTGLREEPEISDEALRRHADEFAVRVRQQPPVGTAEDLKRYLDRMRSRLKERVPVWKAGTSTSVLTPQLELVESARMFEAAIPRSEGAEETFADVPVADLPPVGTLPEVIH